jgi:ATP-binding cassette subfamily F protein uup
VSGESASADGGTPAPSTARHGRADRLSWREQRELDKLPERIGALEAEQATLTRRLEDPGLYAADPLEARRLATRLSEIDAALTALLERWESLESGAGR